jgi:hypothetical protein
MLDEFYLGHVVLQELVKVQDAMVISSLNDQPVLL